MNNVDKAKEIAFDYFHKEELTINSRIEAALRMAKWKDEQFANEKQALINKSCKWLKEHINYYLVRGDINYMVDDFRELIKGGKL